MPAKLIVKVHPDERVEVKVEGLAASDQHRPKEERLCKKLTRRLEEDLGEEKQCVYFNDGPEIAIELMNRDHLHLGE